MKAARSSQRSARGQRTTTTCTAYTSLPWDLLYKPYYGSGVGCVPLIGAGQHNDAMACLATQGNGGFYKLVADTKRIIRQLSSAPCRGKHAPAMSTPISLPSRREHREILPFAALQGKVFAGDKIMDLAGGICQHYVHAMLKPKNRPVERLAIVCSSRAPPKAPSMVTWV